MIFHYFTPEEPETPYFLIRAYDLGRLEVLMRMILEEAGDLTDIEEANRGANKILEKVLTMQRLLEVDKLTIQFADPGQGDEA